MRLKIHVLYVCACMCVTSTMCTCGVGFDVKHATMFKVEIKIRHFKVELISNVVNCSAMRIS